MPWVIRRRAGNCTSNSAISSEPFHDGVVMQRVVLVCLVSAFAAGPVAAQRPAAGSPPRPAPTTTPAQTTPSSRVAFVSPRTILDSPPGYAAAESTFFRQYQGM